MSFSDIVLGNVFPSVDRQAFLQRLLVVVMIGGLFFGIRRQNRIKQDTAIPCHEVRCVTPLKPKIVVVCSVVHLVPDTVKQEDVFAVFHHFKNNAG